MGHRGVRDGVDQLGPVLDDAALLVPRPDHETGDVLHEEDRRVDAVAQGDELRTLLRLGREEDAVVGQDPDRVATHGAPAAHQLRPVGLLELLEARPVEDPGQDLTRIEGHAHVDRRDAEQLLGGEQRLVRRPVGCGTEPPPVQVGHDAARQAQRVGLVARQVVAQPRDPGVHASAPELLLVGLLADGHLHQRRPAQEDPGPVLDHDRVVAHARQVGAAGGRGPEDDAHRRDPLCRELGQAPELLAPGHEDVGLVGQVGPTRLDQDDDREPVGLRHVHGTQQLADRGRARGAAAHRRVVADDEALRLGNFAQRHDDAASDRVAGVQSGERAELEHGRPGVDERLEALAHHQLAPGPVPLDVARAAPGEELVVERPHLVGHRPHGAGVGHELFARRGQAGPQRCGHCSVSVTAVSPSLLTVPHCSVSQDGRRFSKKAAIPSAASSPAKSSAERRAACSRPSSKPCAGSERSSSLVARTAPGAPFLMARARARTQSSSAVWSGTTASRARPSPPRPR